MNYFKSIGIIAVSALLLGCSSADKGTVKGGLKVSSDIKLDGNPATVAGVTFRPPSVWKDLGPSGMRQADYMYGPAEGDSEAANMAVFYFGATSGGAVGSNIERWIGQMSMPDGSDPHKAAKTTDFSVDGMPAHLVELNGTYNMSMGGPMMGGETVPKPNYKMAAVVLETPQGNLFFKLTGPEKTADEMAEAFKAMIMDVKKSG
ncbi:conserved exported hypothetical protein [Candidatus Zixiibacteriota bacterium]|nr:conserved exported hypothetical protein [candidate division Zixibacteria bacterium]